MDFTEAVTAAPGSISLTTNPAEGNGFMGTALGIVNVVNTDADTLTINTAAALNVTDVVRIRVAQSPGVMDSAGNLVSSREIWVGAAANNTIDLSNYASPSFQALRGNGGDDAITGTNAGDQLVDGGGLDTLSGGRGADVIVLVENGGAAAFVADTVSIGLGRSTTNAIDRVSFAVTNAGSGFDIASTNAVDHDILSLQSNIIVGNVTNVDGTDVGTLATHSIAGGIITFGTAGNTPIVINTTNLNDAIAYLAANITTAGATVAFRVDSNNSGGAYQDGIDSLYVFQNNGTIPLTGGYVVPDTVVQLEGLVGLNSATLGTVAGANVVRLQDLTPPEPLRAALTSNGIALNFAENVFANAGIALSLKVNGIGADMMFTGVTGSGSTAITVNTATTAPSDWVFLRYTATGVANGLSDAAGNVLPGDDPATFGGSAIGSSSSNTIDLSNVVVFAATGGYDLQAFDGNDILIGSAAGDILEGGAGADLITGGAGRDFHEFQQGESPTGVVSLVNGAAGVLDNGDTFVFAGGTDRITDFASSEGISLNALQHDFANQSGAGWMGATGATPVTSPAPTNGLAVDQGYFLVQGSYNGTTTFTVNTGGADTLVVYDGDSSAGVTQTGLVLSGVTLAQLEASTGGNYISHI